MSSTQRKTWLEKRKKTVILLRKLADALDRMQKDVDISKVTGTSAAVAAGLGTLGCIIAAPFTGGLSTLGIAGFAALGAAGGVVNLGALLGKHCHEKDLIKDVQKALDEDRKESEKLNQSDLDITDTCRQALSLGQDVAKVVKHVQSAVKSDLKSLTVETVILLPLDIYDLVETSIKVNNGSINESAKEVRKIANELEAEMKKIENLSTMCSDHVDHIYPSELEIKDTSDYSTSASYLDLYLNYDQHGQLTTKPW